MRGASRGSRVCAPGRLHTDRSQTPTTAKGRGARSENYHLGAAFGDFSHRASGPDARPGAPERGEGTPPSAAGAESERRGAAARKAGLELRATGGSRTPPHDLGGTCPATPAADRQRAHAGGQARPPAHEGRALTSEKELASGRSTPPAHRARAPRAESRPQMGIFCTRAPDRSGGRRPTKGASGSVAGGFAGIRGAARGSVFLLVVGLASCSPQVSRSAPLDPARDLAVLCAALPGEDRPELRAAFLALWPECKPVKPGGSK